MAKLLQQLSSSVSSAPCLYVSTVQSLFFVSPAPSTDQPAEDLAWQRDDDRLRCGTVTLILPARRRVTSLKVQIVGTATVSVPGRPVESWPTHDQTLEMDVNEELGAGEHRFEFVFRFPSTTAPYERTIHGGVTHKIVATASGLGRLGGNLTAQTDIEVVALDTLQSRDGPKPFEMAVEGFHHAMGPWSLRLSSAFLTVGGILDLELHFHSPSISVQIEMCVVFGRAADERRIEAQIIECHSISRRSGEVIEPPSVPRTIFVLDGSSTLGQAIRPGSMAPPATSPARHRRRHETPLHVLSAGQPFIVKESIRLPNDDCAFARPAGLTPVDLRSSTKDGTNTPFRVSHKFELNITYTVNDESKVLSIEKPITIYSCCCHLTSLLLPTYSQKDPLNSIDAICGRVLKRSHRPGCAVSCICGMAIEQLRDEQGRFLHTTLTDPILPPMPKDL